MRKIALMLLLIAAVFMSAPGIIQAQSTAPCPTAPPPRLALHPGEVIAQVLPGLPNVVRSQPAQGSASVIRGLIPAGGIFDLLDGPVCGNGMNWWLVNYNGVIGWTPEASTLGEYWLAPLTCSALPARLSVGSQGRVTPGLPNVIRTLAGSGDVIGQIPAGGVFTVFAGPQCANNVVWWQVNYNGVVGWTGESQGSAYWVEPYSTTPPATNCYNAPAPHMLIGMTGIVQPGTPNMVRSQPTLSSQASGQLAAGDTFYVISGPICADGLQWWQVSAGRIGGWTAEGQSGVYWIDTVSCGGSLPSRMIDGDSAWVSPGLPNALRASPGAGPSAGAVIGSIPPYGTFMVISGPQCASGMIWWQVSYNGLIGWTAEGQDDVYWLTPCNFSCGVF
jgi:hypothetical protein